MRMLDSCQDVLSCTCWIPVYFLHTLSSRSFLHCRTTAALLSMAGLFACLPERFEEAVRQGRFLEAERLLLELWVRASPAERREQGWREGLDELLECLMDVRATASASRKLQLDQLVDKLVAWGAPCAHALDEAIADGDGALVLRMRARAAERHKHLAQDLASSCKSALRAGRGLRSNSALLCRRRQVCRHLGAHTSALPYLLHKCVQQVHNACDAVCHSVGVIFYGV